MNHERASELLLELSWGDLAPGQAREVEAHAASCEACRAELAAIRGTRALMAKLPEEPPPEAGMGIVMAAARQAAEARANRRRPFLPPWLWAGSIGAVAAIIAVVSWQQGKQAPPSALRRDDAALLGGAAPAPAPATAGPSAPPAVVAEAAPSRKGSGTPEAATKAEAAPPPAPARPAAAQPPAVERRAFAKDESPKSIGIAADRAEEARPAPAPPPAAPPPSPSLARSQVAAGAAAPSAAREEPEFEAGRTASAPSAEKKGAAPMAAARKASRALDAPGDVRVRSFADCPGERRRVVERDGDGNVVRYVREGATRTVEQRYAPTGELFAAFAVEGGVRRPLPLTEPGLVLRARDATIDAPPRCAP